MKLRKAKRFNTIESYATCVCLYVTCSCTCAYSCSSNPELDNERRLGAIASDSQKEFNINYYSHQNIYG